MLARAAIFVMLLFVIAGGAVYDRYLTSQGKISPLARLLDYAGLAKYVRVPDETVHRTVRKEVFNNEFSNLQETQGRIEVKRAELVNHRKAILQELARTKELMRAEVEAYLRILNMERDDFSNQHPEIRTEVADAHKVLNPPATNENSVTMAEVQKKFLDECQSIIKLLEREDQTFATNLDAIEQQWHDGETQTIGQVQSLVVKLNMVTEADWRELARLYEDLWRQQQILMEESALTYQRLQESYTSAVQRRKIIEQQSATEAQEAIQEWGKTMRDLDRQLNGLMKKVASANQENQEILKEVWVANNNFFHNTLVLKDESPKALTVNTSITSTPVVSRPVPRYQIEKLPKQPSIDEQLQPLRERARQDGFYDHMKTPVGR